MTPAVTPYTTRLLTPDTWDDFAALVEANNGVWGGCWCIGFHPEGITKDSTVAGNREAKLAHVNNGTIHQMLVYRDGRCVGWCQYGPPTEVATIKNPKAYEKGLAELPDWRIGCIFTNAKDRGRGVAAAAVANSVAAIEPASAVCSGGRFRCWSVERPFYKFDGIDCRLELDTKLVNRLIHRCW